MLRLKALRVEINALWREYCRIFYPAELQGWLQGEMARLLEEPDEERLGQVTGEGTDCGDHAAVLAGFRDLVRDCWGLVQ